jgi:hypothetical protein
LLICPLPSGVRRNSRRSYKDLDWQRVIDDIAAEIWIVTVWLGTVVCSRRARQQRIIVFGSVAMFAYPVPADGKAWIVAATTFLLSIALAATGSTNLRKLKPFNLDCRRTGPSYRGLHHFSGPLTAQQA